MGRYTSVQSFSDENTKVVGGYGGDSKQDSEDGEKKDGEKKRKRLETEKIIVVRT